MTELTRDQRYYRGIYTRGPYATAQTLEERFWAKVAKSDEGCWEWAAGRREDGYGQFSVRSCTPRRAHIVAWELVNGPVPDGLELDHLCRNRACVNPDHLEPVTHATNVRRGIAWATNGMRTHCKRGHLLAGDNLYVYPKSGARGCRACQAIRAAERKARRG